MNNTDEMTHYDDGRMIIRTVTYSMYDNETKKEVSRWNEIVYVVEDIDE